MSEPADRFQAGSPRVPNKDSPKPAELEEPNEKPAAPEKANYEGTLSVLVNATGELIEHGQQAAASLASPVNSSCRYRPQKYCAVCGDKAIACNFNAVTCESCKAFFRRNAFKEQRLKCLFENRCVIDRVTRRFCSKCRLLKCFQIGMKREWILTDEQKQIKRVKIMQNKKCKSLQSDDEHDNPASSSPNQQQVVAKPVETRDAATSCLDEQERLYCSLAAQCQFCSLRLAGQHQHRHHQVQVARMQHYAPASGQHLSTNGYPISVVDEQATSAHSLQHLQRSGGASRIVGITSPALGCCCLDANGLGQPAPQLHVMTPSQAPISVLHLVSPESVSYGVFNAQHLAPNGSMGAEFAQPAGNYPQHSSQAREPAAASSSALPEARQVSEIVASEQAACQSTSASPAAETAAKCEPTLNGAPSPSRADEPEATPVKPADELLISKLAESADTQQQALLADNQLVDGEKPGYIVYNGELYIEPAHTEADLRTRLDKLEFLESEQVLIAEMIEATKFMFESNGEHKTQNSLNDVVHICDASLRRLIKTVKQIKAFRMLNMDDQIILLKAACFKILLLRSTYHYVDNVEGWIDAKTGKTMLLDILKRAKKSLVYDRHRELIRKIPEPLRKDRLIMSIMSMALLFDPNIDLKHANSVSLDNTMYLITLRKYLILTQPDPLSKYESLVSAIKVINACTEEYNVFFSKDFQPEQITPLLIEIFDISTAN